jgi:hypothetical protein
MTERGCKEYVFKREAPSAVGVAQWQSAYPHVKGPAFDPQKRKKKGERSF